MEKVKLLKKIRHWGLMVLGCVIGILNPMGSENIEASKGLGGPSHIGTFEGSTTFTTSSSNGINPGLYLEVIDEYGNYTEYASEEGVITLPNTQEGAYITQAKLLGKTKYRDQDTGELLDQWEAGRNLKLESVEGPGLKTTGKNLFDAYKYEFDVSSSPGLRVEVLSSNSIRTYCTDTIAWRSASVVYRLKPHTWYNIRCEASGNGVKQIDINIPEYGSSYNPNTINCTQSNNMLGKFLTDESGKVKLSFQGSGSESISYDNTYTNIQIEEISDKNINATSYEPYQSNILTVNEPIELRGIGKVKDELNLLTGEFTERLITKTYDGSENWGIAYSDTDEKSIYFQMNDGDFKNGSSIVAINNLVGEYKNPYADPIYNTMSIIFSNIRIRLGSEINTLELFKDYLSKNNLIITAERSQKSIKTVALNSTYYFQPVLNRSVEVNGTVLPLVYSVTVPTDPLSFVLNPNAEEGQRFIAPTFTITNDTPASIQIELKAFEQTTNTFRDVLPTKYEDWNQLSKDQSKDFALALLPVPSEGWASLKEGPRYVADSSNYDLGEIKAESSVDFTFTASHGRAFVERLNPQYRLSFIFGF